MFRRMVRKFSDRSFIAPGEVFFDPGGKWGLELHGSVKGFFDPLFGKCGFPPLLIKKDEPVFGIEVGRNDGNGMKIILLRPLE